MGEECVEREMKIGVVPSLKDMINPGEKCDAVVTKQRVCLD